MTEQKTAVTAVPLLNKIFVPVRNACHVLERLPGRLRLLSLSTWDDLRRDTNLSHSPV